MNPDALTELTELIRDCGPSILQMHSSCEIYLQQYVGKFPVEHELLVAAFRVGVAERIDQFKASSGNYEHFLTDLKAKFADAVHTDAEAAEWTIDAWASALGKPPGRAVTPIVDTKRYPGDNVAPDPLADYEQTLMTLIVCAGGFLGGFCATVVFPLVFLLTDFALTVNKKGMNSDSLKDFTDLPIFVVFVILGIGIGIVGALAALTGWKLGGGNERPWATFSITFGTAFVGTFCVGLLMCLPLLVKPVVYFCTVFGTTYTSAARGGHY